MESGESEKLAPQEVRNRLNELFVPDGFRQSIPGLFVRNQDENWRAWIGVSGNLVALFPHVGVYSAEAREIAVAARRKIGKHDSQPPDSGPPLLFVHIERLIGDDANCLKRMTWECPEDTPLEESMLKPQAADDLVYCLRKKAYPFFASHMSYESVLEAAQDRMASFAFVNYVPIILIKLGRRDEVPGFVQRQAQRSPQLAENYKKYVDAILEIMAA
jgi:hypothetical protein